jgi:calcium-dependent protein kinase
LEACKDHLSQQHAKSPPPGLIDLPAKDKASMQAQRSHVSKITELYSFEHGILGEGSFGAVCKAKEKRSGSERAIKQIAKRNALGKDRTRLLHREMQLQETLHNPHIVHLYETFEDNIYVYLVMEICSGGELFDLIVDSGHFSESNCARVMQQLLYGLNYLHTLHIAHRDLKPENLLLSTKVKKIADCHVKLADFGFAQRVEPGTSLESKCGTPKYVAPEVMMGSYDERCDMWSAGVIMYIMLSGQAPFTGSTNQVLQSVVKGQYSFPDRYWSRVGLDSMELIRCLLVDRTKRLSADAALQTEWVKHHAPKADDVIIHDSLVANMHAFQHHSRTHQLALHAVATHLDQSEIQELQDIFVSMDTNHDGQLSFAEFKRGLQNGKLKELPGNLKEIMEEMDIDHSGFVDYTEFVAATMEMRLEVQMHACWRAFRHFDVNGDGRISREEFQRVLDEEHLHSNCSSRITAKSELAALGVPEGQEYIEFDEFLALIRGT